MGKDIKETQNKKKTRRCNSIITYGEIKAENEAKRSRIRWMDRREKALWR
jgi:hypothetical protein